MNKRDIMLTALKGVALGLGNVIPGVSGGTIALITGIFERLINAIKSFNPTALGLLIKCRFKAFAVHTDLTFLTALFFGVVVALFSVAKLLAFLFESYSVYVWAYFFGLILASIFYVGKTIEQINFTAVCLFVAGAAVAVSVALLNPAVENSNIFYLFLCGALAISSMILPGVSGSFVLILMGNYELIVIDAVTRLRLSILIPFGLGCGVGLLAFSHFLAWLLKRYRDATIALLTGFISGSLVIIWPWKKEIYQVDAAGLPVLKPCGDPIIVNYHRYLPDTVTTEVVTALCLGIIGILTILTVEKIARFQASAFRNQLSGISKKQGSE